jgi:hypothetical protein
MARAALQAGELTAKEAHLRALARQSANVDLAEHDLGLFIGMTTPLFDEPEHLRPLLDALDRSMREPVYALVEVAPRQGKPLHEETLVTMADGSLKPLRSVAVGDRVVSGRGRITTVTAVFDKGVLPVFRIRTRSGREVVAEETHRFFAQRGAHDHQNAVTDWFRVNELRPYERAGHRRPRGDALMLGAQYETRPVPLAVDVARFLGYMIGDGNSTQKNCRWTNVDPVLRAEFTRIAESLGGRIVHDDEQTLRVQSTAKSGAPKRRTTRASRKAGLYGGHARHPLKALLRLHDLDGKTAHHKRVPSAILTAQPEAVLAFVAAYFECDGTRAVFQTDGRAGQQTSFSSVSRELLVDVQTLLARFGIRASLRRKVGRYAGMPHVSWGLAVYDQARFFDVVPVLGAKGGPLEASRRYQQDKYLADTIVSIEPAGGARCLCITVKRDASFLANGFVTHNTETLLHGAARRLRYRKTDGVGYMSYSSPIALRKSRRCREMAGRAGVWTGDEVIRNRNRFDPSQAVSYWQTIDGGSFTAGGRGAGFTGDGYQMVIGDDLLKNREEAESPVYQEKAIEAWRGLATRIEPGGSAFLSHQPWNDLDPIAQLKSEQVKDALESGKGAPAWEIISLPAVIDAVYSESGRLIGGTPLWPARWSLEALARRKHDVKDYNWFSQYTLDRKPRGNRLFGDPARYLNATIDGAVVVISCDPGIEDDKMKDSSGIVVGSCFRRPSEHYTQAEPHYDARIDLLLAEDQWRDIPDLLDYLELLQTDVFKGAPILLEEVSAFKALSQVAKRLNKKLRMYSVVPKGNKYLRAQPTAGSWNAGRIRVPLDAPWVTDFLYESARFTGKRGGKDNRIDALTQLFDYAERVHGQIAAGESGGQSTMHDSPF